jgi:hypothetical protein
MEVAFPNQSAWLFGSAVLLPVGQGLQNGAAALARLTSCGQSPYFPKLDSSFYSNGSDDDFFHKNLRVVSKLHFVDD